MKGENEMDKLFHDALSAHESQPSSAVWDGIEAYLDDENGNGAMYKKYSLLLLLLLSCGTIGYMLYTLQVMEVGMAKLSKKVEVNSTAVEASGDQDTQAMITKEAFIRESSENMKSAVDMERTMNPTVQGNHQEIHNDDQQSSENADWDAPTETKYSSTHKSKSSQNSDPIKLAEDRIKIQSSVISDQNSSRSKGAVAESMAFDLAKIDIMGITYNVNIGSLNSVLRPISNFNRKGLWMLQLMAVRNMNSKKLDGIGASGEMLADSLKNFEETADTYGGEVRMAYQLHSGWRFSSGLAYSKWCRSAQYPFQLDQADVATAVGETAISQNLDLQGPTGITSLVLENPALNIIGIPNFASDSIHQGSIRVEECYALLSVPLNIEYKLIGGNWSVLPGVGLNYDQVLSREVMYSSIGSDVNIIAASAQNSFRRQFLSYSLGVALEYSFTERLGVRLHGNYKRWITPIYKNDSFKTYPYLFSGSLGLTYVL